MLYLTRIFKSDWKDAKWLIRSGKIEVLLFEEIETFDGDMIFTKSVSIRVVDRRPHSNDVLLMVDGADVKLFENDRFARIERDDRVIAMVFSDVRIQYCPEVPED